MMGLDVTQLHITRLPTKPHEIGCRFAIDETLRPLSQHKLLNGIRECHRTHPKLNAATLRRERLSYFA